jgi:hypothetical protein
MKLQCPKCKHSAEFDDATPAHEILAQLQAAPDTPETEASAKLDQSGSVLDASRLLHQQRRARRGGVKPHANAVTP